MSDIVERLRKAYEERRGLGYWDTLNDAADEIQRLRAHIKELKIEIGELERGGMSWKEATS